MDSSRNLSDHLPLAVRFRQTKKTKCTPEGKKKNLVTGQHLFNNSLFRSLVTQSLYNFAKEVNEERPGAWKRLVKEIQTAVKRTGPRVKKARQASIVTLEKEVEALTKAKLEGTFSWVEQKRWLASKAELEEIQLEEIRKARLQSRSLFLKPEAANQKHFFRTLKVKRRREKIAAIEDEKGKVHEEPNAMANLMLNHLGQIIGLPEDESLRAKEARVKLLGAVKKFVSNTETQLLV